MRKIVCDTNVWYLIKSEPAYKPTNDKLILTASNYFDWFASNWMDPNHEKHKRLLASYRCAKENHSDKLIIDPFDFAAIQIAEYEVKHHTTRSFNAAEKCLDEMLEYTYNTKQITNIRAACACSKLRFVTQIKNNNSLFYENCSDQIKSEDSGKYKLKKDCIVNEIQKWIMKFPGFQEKGVENIEWDKIDVFIKTYYKFVNNKPKSPKPNSMIDLLNFLYLIDEQFIYWSEEKEFLELVRQSYGNEIPSFIYPDGKIVKQIFCN